MCMIHPVRGWGPVPIRRVLFVCIKSCSVNMYFSFALVVTRRSSTSWCLTNWADQNHTTCQGSIIRTACMSFLKAVSSLVPVFSKIALKTELKTLQMDRSAGIFSIRGVEACTNQRANFLNSSADGTENPGRIKYFSPMESCFIHLSSCQTKEVWKRKREYFTLPNT